MSRFSSIAWAVSPALAFACIVAGSSCPAFAADAPLDVCGVLESLMTIPNGSSVRVRGEVVMTDESLSLKANQCAKGFETEGRRWPDGLALSQTRAMGLLFPDTFETDREVIATLRQMAKHSRPFVVTVVGRLKRRDYWRKNSNGVI